MSESLVPGSPYAQAAQRREAGTMGMYVFLGTEVMLFGGLFTVIAWARLLRPREFVSISSQLDWVLGGINTAVLLTSSLCAALAVAAAREGPSPRRARALRGTAGLGLAFLALKGFEYHGDFSKGLIVGHARIAGFENIVLGLYYISTVLHALHLGVGVLLAAWLIGRPRRRAMPADRQSAEVRMFALYWHFVDIVWVFLYPMLYLARS